MAMQSRLLMSALSSFDGKYWSKACIWLTSLIFFCFEIMIGQLVLVLSRITLAFAYFILRPVGLAYMLTSLNFLCYCNRVILSAVSWWYNLMAKFYKIPVLFCAVYFLITQRKTKPKMLLTYFNQNFIWNQPEFPIDVTTTLFFAYAHARL